MNVFKLAITLVVLTLVSACSSSGKVFSDFDPNQKFDGYKTFAWASEQPGLVSGNYPVSALEKSKIGSALRSELLERGFAYSDSRDDADFLISFTLGARDKIKNRLETEYRVDPNAWRWGRMYYPYYYRDVVVPVTTRTTYQFTEGSIAVDIFDAKDKRPVWHSSAFKRLNTKDLAGSENKQRETAKALLAGFPPQL